jgi:nucleotide-binding universal stress UspA family protein
MKDCDMAIKHVLVCVEGSSGDSAALGYSLQTARQLPVHIDVLHVRLDPSKPPKREGWYTRQVDRLFGIVEVLERSANEAAARAKQGFEHWRLENHVPLVDQPSAVHNISAAWREIKGYEVEVIASIGRLTDLIIIARPESGPSLSLALEVAVFDTGRPLLIVPCSPPTDLFFRPIIAWNGSPEAARAITCAIPLLTRVQSQVDIFTAVEAKHDANSEELLRYLNWHGAAGKEIAINDTSHSVAENLLAHAKSERAGLIVMGAYTHGHYRQFMLGGVTQHVMQHANVPVLMVH